MTRGIGVRIAHNTPVISTKDALIDRIVTSVNNAKQKKTTKTAQHKDLTSHSHLKDWLFLRSHTGKALPKPTDEFKNTE